MMKVSLVIQRSLWVLSPGGAPTPCPLRFTAPERSHSPKSDCELTHFGMRLAFDLG
jgi:hypothetical protein